VAPKTVESYLSLPSLAVMQVGTIFQLAGMI
jgi:hypothetical protein